MLEPQVTSGTWSPSLPCSLCSLQLCPTRGNPIDYSLPGSSVPGTRWQYWSGLSCPPLRDLPTQGLNPHLLRLLHCRRILYCWATSITQNTPSFLYICPSIIPEALHPPLRYSCLTPSSSLAFAQMSHFPWVLSVLLIYIATPPLLVSTRYTLALTGTSLLTQKVENPPAVRETWVWSLGGKDPGGKDPLEKGMTTHCSILVWRIPWTV